MILKPNKVLLILSLFCFIIIFTVTVSVYYSFQKNTITLWEAFISKYVAEKNLFFNNSFFQNVNSLNDYYKLNYNYFKKILEQDDTLESYSLSGLFIYTVDGSKVFSQKLSNQKHFEYLTESQIFDSVKKYIYLNNVTVKHITVNGSKFSLVVAPLFNSYKTHYITVVYLFNNDYLYSKNSPFNAIIFMGWGLFIVFIMIIITLLFVYKKYINDITHFIEFNVFEKNANNPYKLHFLKPFDSLERKITYLISQRKELEVKYFELTERFHYLISLTGEGLVMEDDEGFIYFCNNRFAKILDYEDESELIGVKFIELLYDEDELRKYEIETKFRQLKPQSTYRLGFVTKKGFRKECLLTGSLILNNQNEVIGYYGAITDISGINSFNQSETELLSIRSAVVDQFTSPIIVTDNDDIICDVNDAFINFINKPKSDLISIHFEDIIKGYEIEKSWNSNTLGFELFEPSLNQWFYVSTRKVQHNSKWFKLIVFFTINHLKKQQQYHKLILDDLKGFFFITNKENYVLYVSPSFTRITQNPESWFNNYYNSLINLSKNKSLSLMDSMVITHHKTKFSFKISQISTESSSLNLFLATLK